jgi:hypothetical protein
LSSRTRREAAAAPVRPLEDVVGCLTDDGFVSRGGRAREFHTATFQSRIVTLRRRAGLAPIRIERLVEYTIPEASDRLGWWEARIVGWAYGVLDGAGKPILDFHWHPRDSGRVTWPHLHAHAMHPTVELPRLHPPTGPITVSSIVRFLVEDLGVLPQRPNWQAVLDRHAAV